jgi:hypothetical protein
MLYTKGQSIDPYRDLKEVRVKSEKKHLLRSFLIELVIYAILLVIYFWAIFPFLEQPINRIFNGNPFIYAGVSLVLIVVQSTVLELGIATLIDRLGLGMLE